MLNQINQINEITNNANQQQPFDNNVDIIQRYDCFFEYEEW